MLDILQPSHEVFLMDNLDLSLLYFTTIRANKLPLCNFYMFKDRYITAS